MLLQPSNGPSLRRTGLLLADVVTITLAILCASLIRLGLVDGLDYWRAHMPTALGATVIFLVVFYASGMYERTALTRKEGFYALPLIAVAISLTLVILLFYARYQLGIGRGILSMAGVFIFLGCWGIRHAYRMAVGRGLLARKALVVGEGRELDHVIGLIQRTPDAGFRLVGCATPTRMAAGTCLHGVPVLGSIEQLRETVASFDIETVIVASSLSHEPSLLRALRPMRWGGIEVMDYIMLHEMLAQNIPLDHVDDDWLMNAAMNSSAIHIRKIKRIMDVTVASAGLLFSSPIWIAAAIAVRIDSPGPILFRQRRSGLEGRIYLLLKFRTMRQDAEARSGAVWAGRHDSRVTRVGRWLRRWRVDEFPQLVNVLRGEMSLVGPRPERPEFVETLDQAIPFYKERLLVPPGITGWAQVKYPYAASIEAARLKLQFDLYYIKHMGFFLDCLILLRTFKTILIGLAHSDEDLPATGEVIAPSPGAQTDVWKSA